MGDPANNFLQKLRSETAARHKALEQLPVSAILMSDKPELHQYTVYLEKMYGFLIDFERVIYPACASFIADINERIKIDKLTQDLVALDVFPKKINRIGEPFFKEHYQTSFKALGGLYVMEGSTLGGQIITRHLNRVLSDLVAGKTKYLAGYAGETGSRWKSFLTAFSDAAIKHHEEDNIIHGAVHTFKVLEQWLSGAILPKTNL